MTEKKFTVKIYNNDCESSQTEKTIATIIHVEEVVEITSVIANFLISKEPHNQLVVVLRNIKGFEITEYNPQ